MSTAACLDHPHLDAWWYAEGARAIDADGRYAQAVAVCHTCPLIDECLAVALADGERFGVWGGKTPMQRQRMTERRGRVAA